MRAQAFRTCRVHSIKEPRVDRGHRPLRADDPGAQKMQSNTANQPFT